MSGNRFVEDALFDVWQTALFAAFLGIAAYLLSALGGYYASGTSPVSLRDTRRKLRIGMVLTTGMLAAALTVALLGQWSLANWWIGREAESVGQIAWAIGAFATLLVAATGLYATLKASTASVLASLRQSADGDHQP